MKPALECATTRPTDAGRSKRAMPMSKRSRACCREARILESRGTPAPFIRCGGFCRDRCRAARTYGVYNFSGSNSLLSLGGSDNGNKSILYSYADTVSWTKGKHAFRFGGSFALPLVRDTATFRNSIRSCDRPWHRPFTAGQREHGRPCTLANTLMTTRARQASYSMCSQAPWMP